MRRSEESEEEGTRQFDFEKNESELVVDFAGVFLMENGNYFHFNFILFGRGPGIRWMHNRIPYSMVC